MLPNHLTSRSKVYTICKQNKTVSLVHRKMDYIIGFKKPNYARRVLYEMNPSPEFSLVRDIDINISNDLASIGVDVNMNIDVGATLFIPKGIGAFGEFHIDQYSEDDFLLFPATKNLGIILVSILFDENEEEFIFKVVVIDPCRP